MTGLEILPAIGLGIIRPLFVLAPLPLAGTKPLPVALQASLALALAYYLMPKVGAIPTLDPLSLIAIVAGEALTGLAIGLSVGLAIHAARMAGELIGNSIGIGFASMIDPANGNPVPAVGQFLSLTAVALFMALDGPVMCVRLVADSYASVPFGSGFRIDSVPVLTRGMATMFASALGLALPVVAATLIVQIALAAMARLAPQLNMFAVGFPATLIVGLLVFALAFSAMGAAMMGSWRATISATTPL